MDKLWAPWRIKYVNQKKIKGCIFCNALKENKDTKNFIVLRSQHCFAILNIFPYNNGHVMIVPNRHLKSLENLKEEEVLNINKVLLKVKSALTELLNPSGFNIGINIGKVAGAGIANHIHTHIVPRWIGDINYMPTLANTKVIPQSLSELHTKLKKALL